jgi:glycosidase
MMQFTGWTADQQWLHDRLKKLLAIRAAHPALRRGKRTTIVGGDADLWVFSMETAGDTVYVAINRGDSTKTATGIPSGLTELVEGGSTSIPPRQTRIWSK